MAVYPKEGSVALPEGLGISARTKHMDAVKKFIDFITSPEGQAAAMNGDDTDFFFIPVIEGVDGQARPQDRHQRSSCSTTRSPPRTRPSGSSGTSDTVRPVSRPIGAAERAASRAVPPPAGTAAPPRRCGFAAIVGQCLRLSRRGTPLIYGASFC